MKDSRYNLKSFLNSSHLYNLGHLPTEGFHPLTQDLSERTLLSSQDGINILKEVDLTAFEKLETKKKSIETYQKWIQDHLKNNKKVFLSGCGATGRLAILLEFFFTRIKKSNSVVGFMAGGDAAFIRSIERFEDQKEFGARQLKELGFKANDLLIGITEGGETPFVIGTVMHAIKAKGIPGFVYCNPKKTLIDTVERSKIILENHTVNDLELFVGEMAISGSTRMQATSIMMAALGFSLWGDLEFARWIDQFFHAFTQVKWDQLEYWINYEYKAYQNSEWIHYESKTSALSVLTDTTERAPTFSLNPFKSQLKNEPNSISYLIAPETTSSAEAWEIILGRKPRSLEWKETKEDTGLNQIYAFDLSETEKERRTKINSSHLITINWTSQGLEIVFPKIKIILSPPEKDLLIRELLLKMILNQVSTLTMTKLGKVKNNIMTHVKPSNGKLIDRAIRYLAKLNQENNINEPKVYAMYAKKIFEAIPEATQDSPAIQIALKKLQSF